MRSEPGCFRSLAADRCARALKAGASYFALVFAVGWILGPIRVLWAEPRFGRMIAILLEAAIMLAVMVATARWSLRRFAMAGSLTASILVGLVAFGILAPVELAGALWFRRLSLANYIAGFANPPGAVALAMFVLFAAMPALVSHYRNIAGIGPRRDARRRLSARRRWR